MRTFSAATTCNGRGPLIFFLRESLIQVAVVQREWQWTVSEEEKELSSWRKLGVSRPARLRESSSTELILWMGGKERGGVARQGPVRPVRNHAEETLYIAL